MAAVLPDIGAVEAPGSWIDRAQERSVRQQEQNQQRQQFEILKPVIQAKAQADQATALAGLQAAHRMEAMRTEAANVAPQALEDFLNATKIENVDLRAQELDRVAGRYAWLENLPENKPFITTLNDARAKAHVESISVGKLQQAKEASVLRAQTDESQIAQRASAAELKAKTDVEMKAMQQEMEKMKQENANLRTQATTAGALDRAKITAGTAANRPGLQAAVKANEGFLTAGQSAMDGIRDAQRGLALLDQVRTGTGAGAELSAQRLGQLFGADVSTAKGEELQRILGDAVLKRVNQTKGSISDKEMALFESYSASFGKSAEGNKAILSAYVQALNRSVDIAKMVNEKRQEGLSEREIQLEVNDFILNNPITIGEPAATGAAGSGDTAAAARMKEIEARLKVLRSQGAVEKK